MDSRGVHADRGPIHISLIESSLVLRFKFWSVRGFNLLEVVIAAFIFSASCIAFLGVWGQQVRALEKTRHRLVANFLAEDLIEESMAAGYQKTHVTDADHPAQLEDIKMKISTRGPSSKGLEDWEEIEVLYHVSREVTIFGVAGKDKLKQVVVKVTWDDSTKVGEVVLETILAGF